MDMLVYIDDRHESCSPSLISVHVCSESKLLIFCKAAYRTKIELRDIK
jgi:hypothetical protein